VPPVHHAELLAKLAQCDVQIADHAVACEIRFSQLGAVCVDGNSGLEPRIRIEVCLQVNTQGAKVPVPLVRHVISRSVAAEQVTRDADLRIQRLETEIPGPEDVLFGEILDLRLLAGLRRSGPAERLEIVHFDRPLFGPRSRGRGPAQLGDLLVQGLDLGGALPSHLAQLLNQFPDLLLELRELFLLRGNGRGPADGRRSEENRKNGERCQYFCTHVVTSTQKGVDPRTCLGGEGLFTKRSREGRAYGSPPACAGPAPAGSPGESYGSK